MAFAFGRPPHELAATLPEREFARLWQDATVRFLPQRRLELMLARVCLLIHTCMGGAKDAQLSDYLFDPSADGLLADDSTEPTTEDLQAAFGFSPINVYPGDAPNGE